MEPLEAYIKKVAYFKNKPNKQEQKDIIDIYNIFKDRLGIESSNLFYYTLWKSGGINKILLDLFIKKLGLEKLKSDLTNLYRDDSLLANFQAGNVLLDNSGTTFNNVNGSAILASNINNFVVDAQAAGLSNKFVLKIDNSSNNTIIDMVNTSIVMTKVGETNLPLYSLITFKEDFANKAKLVVDTSQIDDYVSKIRKTKGIKEPKKIKYDNLLQNMINSKDEIDVNNGEQNVSNTDNNIQFQEITTGTENIPNTEQSAVNSDVTE